MCKLKKNIIYITGLKCKKKTDVAKPAENKTHEFTHFSANVACSLIPTVNMMGVIRTARPVNIPEGSEEYTLSVNCIVTVYEYLHKDIDTKLSTFYITERQLTSRSTP